MKSETIRSWIDPGLIRASTARDVVERIHAAAARDVERRRASITGTIRSERGRAVSQRITAGALNTFEATGSAD